MHPPGQETLSNLLRSMARGLVEAFPDGMTGEQVQTLASTILINADNAGHLEHTVERLMLRSAPPAGPRRLSPWPLAEPPCPTCEAKVLLFRPRALPVDVPVPGGAA
jgi:hypothetical protein